MVKRNLDGYYFRVERDGKWRSICFTDLTNSESSQVLEGKSDKWLESLFNGLCDVYANICGQLYNFNEDVFKNEVIQILSECSPYTKVMQIKKVINLNAEVFDIVGVDDEY